MDDQLRLSKMIAHFLPNPVSWQLMMAGMISQAATVPVHPSTSYRPRMNFARPMFAPE